MANSYGQSILPKILTRRQLGVIGRGHHPVLSGSFRSLVFDITYGHDTIHEFTKNFRVGMGGYEICHF